MARKRKLRAKKPADVGTLASRTLHAQLGEARLHVAGAIEGTDPEELHDLRVAVRRMRAALRLFERALPAADSALDPARVGLKETGATLGRARDLDVQIARLEAWVASTGRGQDPAARRAVGLLSRDRTIARLALRRHLRGPVFGRRLASVEEAANAARRAPARRSALRLLRRPSKQVLLSLGRARANSANPTAFHALRIDVKRLRYALEFLDPALPFSTRKLIGHLRTAQDALGSLQDASVEQALAEALIVRASGDDAVRNLLELYRHSQAEAQRVQLVECASLLDNLEEDIRALRQRL